MEKEKTPLDLYQQEVGNNKPQTNDEVLKRFEYLSNVRDDHFLRGEVYSNDLTEDSESQKKEEREKKEREETEETEQNN